MESTYDRMIRDFEVATLLNKKCVLAIGSKDGDILISCLFDPGDLVYSRNGDFEICTDNGVDVSFSSKEIREAIYDTVENVYRIITKSFEFCIGII